MKKRIIIIGFLLVMILGIGFFYFQLPMIEFENNINIEINSHIDPYSYIKDYKNCHKEDIQIDLSQCDITKLGEQKIIYHVNDKEYEVVVHVVDSIAPLFQVNDLTFYLGDEIKANECVSDIQDETKTTVSFKEDYDFSKEGSYHVMIVVKDEGHNQTEKEMTITIIKDTEKPTLSGIENKTITVGHSIDYLNGVTAKDNHDPNPQISVDSSDVNTAKVGKYQVKYTVKDKDGNMNSYQIIVSVVDKKVVQSIPSNNDKIVYLTFDDGPSANTKKILDILDKYHAKATFFVTGDNGSSRKYRSMIKEIHKRGHTVALHTYSHDFSIYKSVDAYFNDLTKIGNVVKEEIGFVPHFIRFPGGSSNTVSRKYCKGIMTTLVSEVQNRGYQYYDWNVDSTDASGNNIPASQIIKASIGYSYHNINLLMHDTGAKKTTVEALPSIIEYYVSKGYSFKGINQNSFSPHFKVNN